MPEKRLFLRSGTGTRFIRLTPLSQIFTLVTSAAFIGWAIVATAIVLLDTIGTGNFRDQARRDQAIYEERLNALANERDTRAQEALTAQERFNTALAQVSEMQSELLTSEDQRRELDRAMEVMQATLRRVMGQRELLQRDLDQLAAQLDHDTGKPVDDSSSESVASTMDYVTDTLEDVAVERDHARRRAFQAHEEMANLELEIQFLEEKGDRIFRQLEEAMSISVKPLDKMFRNAGLNTERLLEQVRRGYSGQGGALSPITYAPDALNTVDPTVYRAKHFGSTRQTQYLSYCS